MEQDASGMPLFWRGGRGGFSCDGWSGVAITLKPFGSVACPADTTRRTWKIGDERELEANSLLGELMKPLAVCQQIAK